MTYGDCTFYNNPISPLFSNLHLRQSATYDYHMFERE